MTDEQYERWKDFAQRMARTAFKGQRRPCTRDIVGMVQEFFDDIDSGSMGLDRAYLAVVEDWDGWYEYPEGHDCRQRQYHLSWCGCNGYRHKNKSQPAPHCPECHGSGLWRAWWRGPILCDVITNYEEHWMPGYWSMPDDPESAAAPQWENRRDRWCDPPTCCIRAGFDLAVSPSDGVMGFTAGDLRRMYPEGVPDWVKRDGPWNTVPLTGVVPGIGYTLGESKPNGMFDELPDEAEVWI